MEQDIKNIRIEEYNYELPDEKIAKYPLNPRDSSKLLIYKNNEISEDSYAQLPNYLPENSLLLFNQTRVVQARLKFRKNETSVIEIFCLEPAEEMDIQQAMQSSSPLKYKCLVGGARKWKSGILELKTSTGQTLCAEKLDREDDIFIIRFSWSGDRHFASILEDAGNTPLPPYLHRDAEEADKKTYQTLFALNDGSVAAPTAGLHFSKDLLLHIKERGIQEEFITLHVGAGTFKPVSSEKVADHSMHYEEFFIEKNLVHALLQNLTKSIIPVGTTSLRALESIYWLGVNLIKGEAKDQKYTVSQWEPYSVGSRPSPAQALQAVADEMTSMNIEILMAKTQLIIAPGYNHQICSGLITNFHQPKSTLLLLVASFIGKEWKEIYDYALSHNFRFLSYGDGCLILKNT